MKHLLTIAPDYVSDWNEWCAIRELLQNVLDQSEVNGETPIFTWNDGLLTIGLPKCELLPETLLLGKSSKMDDHTKRGQFGEGYKLALLVFARKLYDVKIRTGSEEWIATIVHSKEYNSNVLQVERNVCEDSVDGVYFTISKIPEHIWHTANSCYLKDAKDDTILDDRPHMIFVGGLFVKEMKSFTLGYNFAPHRIKIGRDRDIVNGYDVSYQASQLWADAAYTRLDQLFDLMKSDAADVRHVEYMPEQAAQIIAKKYEKEFGEGTTPVLNQSQLDKARESGLRAQIVPSPLRTVIKRVRNFVFYERTTPGFKMHQFLEKYESKLDLDCLSDLKFLVSSSLHWRS